MKRALVPLTIFTLSIPLSLRAESGNVQIYGTINVDYESVQATRSSSTCRIPISGRDQ